MGLIRKPNSRFWWINIKVSNKRIFESTKTENKKKAQEILSIRHAELLTGQNSRILEPQEKEKTNIYTFKDLCASYLDWCKGRQASYKIKKYVIPKLQERFKNMTLNEFNYRTIENLQSDYIKANYKPAYINKITAIVKHMFNKALDWEMVTEEDLKRVRKVKQLKGESKRLRYLTEEEAARLIDSCNGHLKPIVITALNTGMRKSEILRLTWNRVDLKNRIILLDKTKNGERREIPINNTLYRALSGLTRHLKTDYVFYNPETLKPFFDLERIWRNALKKSHILDFHFHDLRHTFASRLVMAGIDLTTVKELLGHKDIKMTLRYSHLSQAHVKNAVSVLDKKCDSCVTVGYDEEIVKPENPYNYW